MRKKKSSQLNNKGAAMMLTIVIIAILMIFVFSLILVSYNLYASQTKNLSAARNAEAANTLSIAMENELTDDAASTNSNIWKYLRMNVAYENDASDAGWKEWPYYDENDPDDHGPDQAYRYFTLERNTGMEGVPAEVSVCMYWTPPKTNSASKTAAEILNEKIAANDPDARNKINLHVITIVTTGSQEYSIEDTYTLMISSTDMAEKAALKSIKNSKIFNPAGNGYDPEEKWKWVHIQRK